MAGDFFTFALLSSILIIVNPFTTTLMSSLTEHSILQRN
jgi:hypothetical protein